MQKNNVCILIPVYKNSLTELEALSFARMLKVFKNRDIFLFGPSTQEEFLRTLSKANDISYQVFHEKYFKNTRTYNRLLTHESFYTQFINYEFMVISQLDVFVFNDDIDFWIAQNYDYIGAPIFKGYTNASNEPVFKPEGCNGGFSLRNISKSLEALKNIGFIYSPLSVLWKMENSLNWKIFRVIRDGLIFNYRFKFLKPVLNEDIFWSVIVPHRFSYFNCCKPKAAAFFAFDNHPRFLYNYCNKKLPMAIHAWWRFDKLFVESLINQLDT